jgi:hypothetical protein
MFNKFFSFFLILFLCAHNSFAIIFVDIEVVRNENMNLLRFVQFDTDRQSFKDIRYYQLENNTEAKYSSGGGVDISFVKRPKRYEIDIKSIDFETHAVRINTESYIDKDYVSYTSRSSRKPFKYSTYLCFRNNTEIKTAKYIMQNMKKMGQVYSTFQISLYEDIEGRNNFKIVKKQFASIFNTPADNNYERGVLGELATELTMLSFQYYYNNAKMEYNHGFDGVYIDKSDKPEIFITESKCRSESKSAATYLKEQLSMHNIYTTLTKMSNSRIKSLKTLSENITINVQNNNAYAMVHRILDDGRASCVFHNLMYNEWLCTKLSILSSEQDDEEYLETLTEIAKLAGYKLKK